MEHSQVPALRVAAPLSHDPRDSIPYVPLNYAHPGLSLNQILAILRAHRWRIVVIGLLVSSMSVTASMLLPRNYEATTTLMIGFEINDPLGPERFPTGLLDGYVATQIELIQSPTVLLPVVDRLGLTEDEFLTQGFDRKGGEPLRDWVATQLAKDLSVARGRSGSQLIYVTYTGRDAQQTARIANSISEVYLELHQTRMAGPASLHAERYSDQLKDLKAKVIETQQEVDAFRKRTGIIQPDGNIDVEMGRLQTMEQRLLEAQQARRAAEVRAQEQTSSGGIVMGSVLIQRLKSELSRLSAQHAVLKTSLGRGHPDMQALNAQILTTRSELDSAVQTYAANATTELNSARALEAKLAKAVSEQRARIVDIRSLRDEASRHQLELDSASSVYRQALDGYDRVIYSAEGRYSNIDRISPATPPHRPSSPNLIKFLLLSILLGIVAGIGIPTILELLRRRVRCRDDLERDHGIPVLVELVH